MLVFLEKNGARREWEKGLNKQTRHGLQNPGATAKKIAILVQLGGGGKGPETRVQANYNRKAKTVQGRSVNHTHKAFLQQTEGKQGLSKRKEEKKYLNGGV